MIRKKCEIEFERGELDEKESKDKLNEIEEMLSKKVEEFNLLDMKCR